MKKPLIVSIHDVRPGLFKQVEAMLATLKEHGVAQTSLLVIPDFHGAEPLQKYPEQVEQIRTWGASGHELMLHAYYHREARPASQGPIDYLISQHYTGGEGEFFRLSYEEAQRRLQMGRQLFKRLNLTTSGFTAPAWLYSAGAKQAIVDEGFAYYTTLRGVQPAHRPFIRARAVVWSHRAAWRRATSNLFLPLIAKRLMQNELPVRLALHPPDFSYPTIRACALKILKEAREQGYQPTTYAQWVTAPATPANHESPRGSPAPRL